MVFSEIIDAWQVSATKDAHIFKEASIPAITNFTDDEVHKVGELAKAVASAAATCEEPIAGQLKVSHTSQVVETAEAFACIDVARSKKCFVVGYANILAV